jgi:transcription antitermination protein NusB
MTKDSQSKSHRGTRARSMARKLAMQALYQWQLNAAAAREIEREFRDSEESAGADHEYFGQLLAGCIDRHDEIISALTPFVDRPIEQLDPVEAAILMIGMFELMQRADVPYRVVINEAVDLCKRFGATEAHKYVNAVLDRAARDLRSSEQ